MSALSRLFLKVHKIVCYGLDSLVASHFILVGLYGYFCDFRFYIYLIKHKKSNFYKV